MLILNLKLTGGRKMISLTNSNNVMTWCEVRLNTAEANKIIKANSSGLADKGSVERALQAHDYIGVLKAVWGERDRVERLAWLQTKSFEAVLPYELALAELKSSPTRETLTTKTLPFFAVATARTRMDINCSSDKSLGSVGIQMKGTYVQALHKLIKGSIANPDLALPLSKEEQIIELENSLIKMQELKGNISTLSSPQWVEWCGMSFYMKAFGEGTEGTMLPSETWKDRRHRSIDELIAAMEVKLNELRA